MNRYRKNTFWYHSATYTPMRHYIFEDLATYVTKQLLTTDLIVYSVLYFYSCISVLYEVYYFVFKINSLFIGEGCVDIKQLINANKSFVYFKQPSLFLADLTLTTNSALPFVDSV